VAVVRALLNDVDRLPRVQADGVRDQMAVRPGEAMRIAQAERPDLLARAGGRHERVVVRNAVAAVLAENARRLMVRRVRNDPQDFSDERVEALRVHADAALGFARSAVAASDV